MDWLAERVYEAVREEMGEAADDATLAVYELLAFAALHYKPSRDPGEAVMRAFEEAVGLIEEAEPGVLGLVHSRPENRELLRLLGIGDIEVSPNPGVEVRLVDAGRAAEELARLRSVVVGALRWIAEVKMKGVGGTPEERIASAIYSLVEAPTPLQLRIELTGGQGRRGAGEG